MIIPNEDGLCLTRGAPDTPSWADMTGRRCSLPAGHDGQHIAYLAHYVTDDGADVYWLGPWEDGRAYDGPLTDRLRDEWDHRDPSAPPAYLAAEVRTSPGLSDGAS